MGTALPTAPAELDIDYVDWDEFRKEYPTVEGTAEEWSNRLREAIVPTFAIPRADATPHAEEGVGAGLTPLLGEDTESEAQEDSSAEQLTLGHDGISGPAQYIIFTLPDGQRRRKSGGDERPRSDH